MRWRDDFGEVGWRDSQGATSFCGIHGFNLLNWSADGNPDQPVKVEHLIWAFWCISAHVGSRKLCLWVCVMQLNPDGDTATFLSTCSTKHERW